MIELKWLPLIIDTICYVFYVKHAIVANLWSLERKHDTFSSVL
jgi:hypothetical protein